MDIFLDTNIIYNNWHFQSASFQYLLRFIRNEDHTLILSDVVIKEVENKHNQELVKAMKNLEEAINDLYKLTTIRGNIDKEQFNIQYNLVELINDMDINYRVLSCDNIPQLSIVDRAIKGTRPFQENEKGYRDTLIWISILNHYQSNDSENEIVFICENKNDFYDVNQRRDVSFHPSLFEELSAINNGKVITPYLGISSFIESKVDKNEHAIDRNNFENEISDYIESESEEYILNLSSEDCISLLFQAGIHLHLSHLNISNVYTIEGIEDPVITLSQELDGNSVYIQYQYNLRIVTLRLKISFSDYIKNKNLIEMAGINLTFDTNNDVSLDIIVRPYFHVSFSYDRNNETIDNFAVDTLSFRH